MADNKLKNETKENNKRSARPSLINSPVLVGLGIGFIGLGVILALLLPNITQIRLGLGLITPIPTATPYHPPTNTPQPLATALPLPSPTPIATPADIAFAEDDRGILVFNFADEGEQPDSYSQIVNRLQDMNANIRLIPHVIMPNISEAEQRQQVEIISEQYNANVAIWGTVFEGKTQVYVHTLYPIDHYNSDDPTAPRVPIQPTLSNLNMTMRNVYDPQFIPDFALAQLHYSVGDFASAIPYYDAAVDFIKSGRESDFKAEAIYFYRGFAKYQIQNWDGAIVDLKQSVELYPRLAEAYYYLGHAYIQQQDYQNAVSYFGQALDYHPGFSLAPYHRGLAYVQLGEYKLAIEDFTQAIARNQKNIEYILQRASARFQLRNFEGALDDYNRILDIDPTFYQAYNLRGLTYIQLDDFDRAMAEFTTVIEMNPDDADAFYHRGLTKFNQSDWVAAYYDFEQAVILNPELADAIYHKGRIDLALSQNTDIPLLNQAFAEFTIAIDMEMTQPYLLRGITAYYLQDYEQALSDLITYEALVEPLPDTYADIMTELSNQHDTSSLLWMSAMIRSNNEDYKGAIIYFDNYITSHPNDAEAHFQRGYAYTHSGQAYEAIPNYDRAIQLDPQYTEAYFWRGLARRRTTDYEGGVQDLQQVVTLDPDFERIHHELGYAYWALGDDVDDRQLKYQAIDELTIAIDAGEHDLYTMRAYFYADLWENQLALADLESYEESVGPLTSGAQNLKENVKDRLGIKD